MNFKTTFKKLMAVLICFMLILTSFQFVASAESRLSTNKTEYEVGEDILVTATGSGKDWVAIYEKGVVPSGAPVSIYWYYVADEGHTSGETYRIQNYHPERPGYNYSLGLPTGNYVVYLLENDSYSVVESIEITIGEVEEAALSTDKTVYAEGESIMVTAIGYGSDWVGIYEKGTVPDGDPGSIYWYYASEANGKPVCIQDTTGGRPDTEHDYTIAKGLPAGEYEIFLLMNDGYSCIEKVAITVEKVTYDNLSIDKSDYIEGEEIKVTASGENGQKVGIYKANDTEDALPIYEYELNSSTNGVEFKIQDGVLLREDEKNLEAGGYKVVLKDTNGAAKATIYLVISRKPFDEVLPDEENKEQTGKKGLLKTNKTQYKMGEPIMVTATVSEQQAIDKAWVGIVPSGITVTTGGAVSSYWYYVNDTKYGAKNGEAFDILKGNATNSQYESYYPVTDGYYDIILFAADGYEVLDKVTISRYMPSEIEKDLTMDKVTYTEGEPVYITASSPDENAWVGIYNKDTVPGPELAVHWYWVAYANGLSQDITNAVFESGKSMPAGEYKAVLFNDDGYSSIEKTVYFTIETLDISDTVFDFTINGAEVKTAETIEFAHGETVVVNPTAVGNGVGFSWVGVYNMQLGSDTDFSTLTSDNWIYIADSNGQDWDITGSLTEGPNTVVLFSNSGYDGVLKYAWIYVEREDVLSKEVITKATCTETGITHYVYKNGTEEDIITMPLGHLPLKDIVSVEATPDSIGGVKGICERCNQEVFETNVKFDIAKATINVTTIAGVETPIVSVEYDGQKLVEGKHYELTVSQTEAGKVVTVVGIGKCSGILQSIIKPSLKDATITVADAMFTGKEVKPTVTVKYGDDVLVEGTDYELSYSNNINAGLGKVTVSGIGVYEGEVEKTFKIKEVVSTPVTVTVKVSKTNFVYNGKVQQPKVIVELNGEKLTADDYTVTFAKGCKNVGKYSFVVTLKGDYSASVTKTFTINPKATSISKLAKGKKAITVKWAKKTVEVSGYEIEYSTSKNFKGKKTVKINKAKTTTKIIKKLKANKKYFVRIRTFKKVGKTTYKSTWSKVKSIKTK